MHRSLLCLAVLSAIGCSTTRHEIRVDVGPRGNLMYACDDGDAQACAELGDDLYRGKTGARTLEGARLAYADGCSKGSDYSCVYLAYMELDGDGGPRDPAAGLERLNALCRPVPGDRIAAVACLSLGQDLYKGEVITQSWPRARKAYDTACQAGDAEGCAKLGMMLMAGEGGPADHGAGTATLSYACRSGDDSPHVAEGCRWLGEASALGAGVPRDDRAAFMYFERSCELGDGEACLYLAKLTERLEPGGLAAKDYRSRSCVYRSDEGCELLCQLDDYCDLGA